jgi:hypothetical protein
VCHHCCRRIPRDHARKRAQGTTVLTAFDTPIPSSLQYVKGGGGASYFPMSAITDRLYARNQLTMKIEAAGEGEKATTEGVNAAGTATRTEYTAQYDGKDYPITGSQNADTVALKRIDARTIERTDKKGEKVVVTSSRVVSEDGKTMTVTTTGTNAQGQAMNNVTVWEKQ